MAKREFARLEGRLRGLSAEDFNRESACDKWQVGDVVAHVVFVVQFQKNMTTRGLKGRIRRAGRGSAGGSGGCAGGREDSAGGDQAEGEARGWAAGCA